MKFLWLAVGNSMPILPVICPSCGDSVSEAEATSILKVQRMLDLAEDAGIDLFELEVHRRQLARNVAEYDDLMAHDLPSPVRVRELEQSIELEVNVLASAFVSFCSTQRPNHGRR